VKDAHGVKDATDAQSGVWNTAADVQATRAVSGS
jgi:hypothetical protein